MVSEFGAISLLPRTPLAASDVRSPDVLRYAQVCLRARDELACKHLALSTDIRMSDAGSARSRNRIESQ